MKHTLITFFLFSIGIINAQKTLKPDNLIDQLEKAKVTFREVPLLVKSPIAARSTIAKDYLEAETFTYNQDFASNLLSSNAPQIKITLPSHYRNHLVLKLTEVAFTPFPVIDAQNGLPIKSKLGKHYRGVIEGNKNSLVAISIFKEEMMGLITAENINGNLVLGKLTENHAHILYRDTEVMGKLGLSCETEDNEIVYQEGEIRYQNRSRALSDCIGLYFEVDNDIVVDKGGTTGATNYVTGLYNQVATLYANENINTRISEIVVWTTISPYKSTTASGMLNDFTAYRQGFNGDLGMLLSYRASGGIAYVDGLCANNPDYSMSFSSIGSNYSEAPTYSWSVMVIAHEFGHLFGSQHTHACVWNGNGSAIDGCYGTEGSCPNPGIPSGGGTIMSYCHITSAGINLNKGFGLQPGNVLRSRVSSASCIQACGDNGGGSGSGDTCQYQNATLTILTDNYPGETTWTISDENGQAIYSGGPYTSTNTSYSVDLCLPVGCHLFTINDSYGDGICCAYGAGNYNIVYNNNSLIEGGDFGTSETLTFCLINDDNDATCEDGIQNGEETGIDCGGAFCPPCSSCDDGIQNGTETGVDCGGSDCPDCPTTGSEEIIGHYFENSWDGWQDGGSDCYRYRGFRSPEGKYAIRLRDNSGLASSMTSEKVDLSPYDQITLEFLFYSYSMEKGEDFIVSLYDGNQWVAIAQGVSGENYNNNIIYTATLELTSQQVNFSPNAQLRFRCDASSNSDHIYIDAIVLTGHYGVDGLLDNQFKMHALTHTIPKKHIVHTYPNPASNQLNITMEVDEEENESRSFSLFSLDGKLIKKEILDPNQTNHQVNISSIKPGIYLLQITNSNEEPYIEKITIFR